MNAVEQGVPGSPLSDHWHSIWSVYVAQAGIGYGDLGPKTHIGRAICLLSVFVGVGILSFVIPKSHIWLSLTAGEEALYRQIRHIRDGHANLSSLAAMVIQRYWKLQLYRRKQMQRLGEVMKFNRVIHEFRFRLNLLKASYSPSLREGIDSLRHHSERQITKVSKYLQICKTFKTQVKTEIGLRICYC